MSLIAFRVYYPKIKEYKMDKYLYNFVYTFFLVVFMYSAGIKEVFYKKKIEDYFDIFVEIIADIFEKFVFTEYFKKKSEINNIIEIKQIFRKIVLEDTIFIYFVIQILEKIEKYYISS